MMAWYWYIVIYLVGFLTCWRVAYSWQVAQELDELELINSGLSNGSRPWKMSQHKKDTFAISAGWVATFWPVVAIVVPVWMFVTRPTWAEHQHKQRQRERTELADLRRQAKELGLPFSEVDTADTSKGVS